MSKAARTKDGKYAVRKSVRVIISTWIGALLSLLLLLAATHALQSDIGSFRSCNSNTDTLFVSSCGKQSLNIGDFIIFAWFVLSAALTISLFTAAWRWTRGRETA